MFKFGQIEVMQKEFNRQRQISDIFIIDVNKVVVSEKVPCNNEKDHRYIIGYKVNEETIMPLCIKIPKKIFSYSVSLHLMLVKKKSSHLSTKRSGMRLSHSYLKN